MSSPWVVILGLMSFLPLAIRLTRARQERRRPHLFDDVVDPLFLPLAFSAILLPMPSAATRVILGVALAIWAVSIVRSTVAWRRTRQRAARVDGPPDGR
jgi:hypothetical protein